MVEKRAERNVAKFEEMGVERVVAISPQSFHTLKNDYGEFGGELEVVHHTQLLAELVDEGKLVPGRMERKVTYHDLCYLRGTKLRKSQRNSASPTYWVI